MNRGKYLFRNIIVATVILIGISTGGYYLWKNQQEKTIKEKDFTEGSGPDDETLEYMNTRDESCPVWTLGTSEISTNVKITSYTCDFIETGGDLGEDITVEIYTENIEEGKETFRNWLTENELEESEKLRVEYIHKP